MRTTGSVVIICVAFLASLARAQDPGKQRGFAVIKHYMCFKKISSFTVRTILAPVRGIRMCARQIRKGYNASSGC
jgi:hypothetical protein